MNNSKETFQNIYQENYPKVLRLCKGYVNGSEMAAKDLAQDVFIKVWQNLDGFRKDSRISTWIYRITVNTCLLSLRKKKLQPLDINTHLFYLQEDSNYSEEHEKRFQQLYNCINELSTENKSIILLELEGLPQKEIADIMGLSHEAIRTRLHRIKNQLTKCVKK